MNGIILGLVLGIFGNLIAQYFYLVLEGIMLLRFDKLFYVNGFVFSISIIIVVFVGYYFKKRIAGEKKYLWSMKDGVTNLERRTEDLRVKLEALKLDWEPQEKNHE